eukprot:2121801-Pleurochrysis_carterae.AAC.4
MPSPTACMHSRFASAAHEVPFAPPLFQSAQIGVCRCGRAGSTLDERVQIKCARANQSKFGADSRGQRTVV